jgi:hypothetical protein
MSSRPKSQRVTRSTSSQAQADLADVSSLLALGDPRTGHFQVTFWKVDVAPIVLGVLAFVLALVVLVMAVVLPTGFWGDHAGAMEVAGKVAAGLLAR